MDLIDGFGSFRALTPDDAARVSCRAIYVGGAGNLVLSPDALTPATTFAVLAGQTLYVNLNQGRVLATGTTATGLVALA